MVILRMPQIVAIAGLSRMTIYRLEKRRQFPGRVQLSPNSVGWRKEDVDHWLESLPKVDAPSMLFQLPALRDHAVICRGAHSQYPRSSPSQGRCCAVEPGSGSATRHYRGSKRTFVRYGSILTNEPDCNCPSSCRTAPTTCAPIVSGLRSSDRI